MVSGYPTSMNIPRVDGLSIDPREMGPHRPDLSLRSSFVACSTLVRMGGMRWWPKCALPLCGLDTSNTQVMQWEQLAHL